MAVILGLVVSLILAVTTVRSFPSETPTVGSTAAPTAAPTAANNFTCEVSGKGYQEGESIGDPCDGCLCTRRGIMCQLRMCPPAPCADRYKPEGECCAICPTGPNCEYIGALGKTLIPADTGCRYSAHLFCLCTNSHIRRQLLPFCVPPFPWERNPCNITTATEADGKDARGSNIPTSPELEIL